MADNSKSGSNTASKQKRKKRVRFQTGIPVVHKKTSKKNGGTTVSVLIDAAGKKSFIDHRFSLSELQTAVAGYTMAIPIEPVTIDGFEADVVVVNEHGGMRGDMINSVASGYCGNDKHYPLTGTVVFTQMKYL